MVPCEGNPQVTSVFPPQRGSFVERVSVSWRHNLVASVGYVAKLIRYFMRSPRILQNTAHMTRILSSSGRSEGSNTPDNMRYVFRERMARSTWIRSMAMSRVLVMSPGTNLRPLDRDAQALVKGGMISRAFRSSNRSRIVNPLSAMMSSSSSTSWRNPDCLVICRSDTLPVQNDDTNVNAPLGLIATNAFRVLWDLYVEYVHACSFVFWGRFIYISVQSIMALVLGYLAKRRGISSVTVSRSGQTSMCCRAPWRTDAQVVNTLEAVDACTPNRYASSLMSTPSLIRINVNTYSSNIDNARRFPPCCFLGWVPSGPRQYVRLSITVVTHWIFPAAEKRMVFPQNT